MKFFKIIFFSFIFIGLNTFSQEVAKEPKEHKKDAFKITAVVMKDSTSASELMKRAVNFVKEDSPRFEKTNGITTGSKTEFVAVFKIKPKELNPISDYSGTITMHVSIECKENRFRYTISKPKHTSTNGKNTGGDINNLVPECGSMVMPSIEWKKIKGEALRDSEMIVSELTDSMSKQSTVPKDDW